QPPSLKAMIPWEGAADMYRDFAFHGGIFSFGFAVNWFHNQMANHLLGRPQASSTDAFAGDWIWDFMRHNLDGDWYHGLQARWEDIKVPFLSAGNWSGMGLHLRGNSEAYLRAPCGTSGCASMPALTSTPIIRKTVAATSCAGLITG